MNAVLQSVFKSICFISILVSLSVQAQDGLPVNFSGFWSVTRIPEETELFRQIPEEAIFIDDAGGGELEEGDFGGLKLSEEALQAVRNYDFDSEFDIENVCITPSAVFYMQAPFPIEMHQSGSLLVMKMEYFDMVRLVFMDGREIPENAPHSKNGYSVGHWEGDELVVRTERLSPATFMNNGFNHSENIIMTERLKMSEDGQTLWMTQLYEDPEVFTGIGARYIGWEKLDGEYVYPYECDFSFAL